jgi:hypothetical protein
MSRIDFMPSSFYSALENVDEKTVAPMIGVKIENKLSKPYLELGKQSEPYDLFIFAINAGQTRQKYLTRLNMFFQVIGIDQEKKLSIEERYKLFVRRAGSENGSNSECCVLTYYSCYGLEGPNDS